MRRRWVFVGLRSVQQALQHAFSPDVQELPAYLLQRGPVHRWAMKQQILRRQNRRLLTLFEG
jgi:hypothetical protein